MEANLEGPGEKNEKGDGGPAWIILLPSYWQGENGPLFSSKKKKGGSRKI